MQHLKDVIVNAFQNVPDVVRFGLGGIDALREVENVLIKTCERLALLLWPLAQTLFDE